MYRNCIHQQTVWRLERLKSIPPPCSTCRSESRSSSSLADGYFMLFPATKHDQTPYLSYLYHLVSLQLITGWPQDLPQDATPIKWGENQRELTSVTVTAGVCLYGWAHVGWAEGHVSHSICGGSAVVRWSTRQLTISALGSRQNIQERHSNLPCGNWT